MLGLAGAIFLRGITVALRRSHEVMKVADVGASWQSRVVGVRGVPRRSSLGTGSESGTTLRG